MLKKLILKSCITVLLLVSFSVNTQVAHAQSTIADVGRLTSSVVNTTPAQSQLKPGQTDIPVFNFTLTSEDESALIEEIKIGVLGRPSAKAINSLKLYADGRLIGDTYTLHSDDKIAYWQPDFVIPRDTGVTFSVTADVASQYELDQIGDVSGPIKFFLASVQSRGTNEFMLPKVIGVATVSFVKSSGNIWTFNSTADLREGDLITCNAKRREDIYISNILSPTEAQVVSATNGTNSNSACRTTGALFAVTRGLVSETFRAQGSRMRVFIDDWSIYGSRGTPRDDMKIFSFAVEVAGQSDPTRIQRIELREVNLTLSGSATAKNLRLFSDRNNRLLATSPDIHNGGGGSNIKFNLRNIGRDATITGGNTRSFYVKADMSGEEGSSIVVSINDFGNANSTATQNPSDIVWSDSPTGSDIFWIDQQESSLVPYGIVFDQSGTRFFGPPISRRTGLVVNTPTNIITPKVNRKDRLRDLRSSYARSSFSRISGLRDSYTIHPSDAVLQLDIISNSPKARLVGISSCTNFLRIFNIAGQELYTSSINKNCDLNFTKQPINKEYFIYWDLSIYPLCVNQDFCAGYRISPGLYIGLVNNRTFLLHIYGNGYRESDEPQAISRINTHIPFWNPNLTKVSSATSEAQPKAPISQSFISPSYPFITDSQITKPVPLTSVTPSRPALPTVAVQPDDISHPFRDLPTSDRDYFTFLNLIQLGIIQGTESSTVEPDRLVSRAELIKMLVSARGERPAHTAISIFPDVQIAWQKDYIHHAYLRNWIQGFSDQTFKPNQSVDFAEALKMIFNILRPDIQISFQSADLPWYIPYFFQARKFGIKLTHPHHSLSRRELAVIIDKVL